MAMKKKPGRSKVEVGIPSTEAVFSAGNNNASGSLIANLATQNRAELAYELREIALQDIELNPDNAIFRQLDTDEDVETLANDIDRNGLMHNLVVYPRTDGKQTKYVLLSGERRYKALNYLQARGDAKWNTVKNCRVVTTPLSDNEKKVMLLSANLQVRRLCQRDDPPQGGCRAGVLPAGRAVQPDSSRGKKGHQGGNAHQRAADR